ncbi:MAG: hypothetical protein C0469_06680 [Cyanobacteria bacterium DS2.3.42]|nr:hypothetical protein [Cyanobacteria bacterium DS2.3.42]
MAKFAHILTIFLAVGSMWVLGSSGALSQSQDDYQRAMVIYGAKNYEAAIPLFTKAAQTGNVRATYYLALCHQYLKQDAKAIELFRHISKNFKGSAEAVLCDSYLQRIPQQPSAQASSQSSSPAAASGKAAAETALEALKQKADQISEAQWKALPEKARIPFQMKNGHMYVQAKVKGQYLNIIFDTGASMCAISLPDNPNLFSSAEIQKAPSVPVSRPHGLAYMKLVDGEVSVDRITRNCTIMLSGEHGVTLIGQNFFKEYTYEIDGFYIRMTKAPYVSPVVATASASTAGATGSAGTASAERLVKANNTAAGAGVVLTKGTQKPDAPAGAKKSNDKYSVPFVRQHNCMLVEMTVNGKPTPAMFDTGCAPDGLVMPMNFVQRLGIDRNSDGFFAERAEIGPIIRKYVPVSFANGLDCLLIGPKFFGDRPYTVDPVNNVIKFQY